MPHHDIQSEKSSAASASVPQSQRSTTTTTTITTSRRPDQQTTDIRTSQSSSLAVNTSIANNDDPVFADRQSGVIFTSGLIRASGDRVAVREFCKARRLAPTLHLVIPSSSFPASDPAAAAAAPTRATHVEHDPYGEKNAYSDLLPVLPSFALTLPSPSTGPESSILYPTSVKRTFTRESYLDEVERAPRHMRIPHLPQYCAHTLRPFVPLTKCALCEIQILACEIWWNSRNHDGMAMSGLKRLLCVPQVLPADCTPIIRSIYYALGLPLGSLDESCIDWEIVDVIMFVPSRRSRWNCSRQPQPPAAAFLVSSSSSSLSRSRSRMRLIFRRARRFFSTH